jgi:subtilisin family serine protease
MRGDGLYRLWYSGYNPDRSGNVFVGYATSRDGLHWSRYSEKPIYDRCCWTEDMQVVKHGDTYYMFAEGTHSPVPQVLAPDKGIR